MLTDIYIIIKSFYEFIYENLEIYNHHGKMIFY